MKALLVLSLSAFIVCGTSAARAADGVFVASFKRLCAVNQGRADLVKAAALQEGWSILPAPTNIPDFEAAVALSRTPDDGSKLYLLVGRSRRLIEDVATDGNTCGMVARAQDGAGVFSSIADWAGVPPVPQVGGKAPAYVFTDDADGHHPISDPGSAAAQTLVRDGRVVVVLDQTLPNGETMIGYFHSVPVGSEVHLH